MRLFNHFSSGTLILVLLELFCCIHDSVAKTSYQRCFGDIFATTDSMASLFQSSCKPCESKISVGSIDPHAHILFLLPPWTQIRVDDSETMHPLMSLASIMFRRGFDVSVFQLRDTNCGFRREHIPTMVFSSLPCDESIRPNNTLQSVIEKAYNFDLCGDTKDVPTLESPYDGLDRAPPLIHSLRHMIPHLFGRPHVFVIESTYVAAALVGEKLRVPVIMIAPPTEVDLITERTPVWRGLYHFFETRRRSLINGMRLMKMNMVRTNLCLLHICRYAMLNLTITFNS